MGDADTDAAHRTFLAYVKLEEKRMEMEDDCEDVERIDTELARLWAMLPEREQRWINANRMGE
jgi:hypothetical protein